ncbi:MAG: hypothetical protein AB8B97_15155 [Granulosicoccus sp.]
MDSATLSAKSPLGGYAHTFDDTEVREIPTLVIVSISVPRDGMNKLEKKLESLWQVSFPTTGACTRIKNTGTLGSVTELVLYGLQSDQCFLVAEPQGSSSQAIMDHVHASLGNVAYLTDQSDSWAVLDVQGPLTLRAMERICMLDLDSLSTLQVARTTMEHLSVIVEKSGHHHVRLYSPRSSASDFLHAVTTSLANVQNNPQDQKQEFITKE